MRTITPESLFEFSFVSNPSYAPDGSMAAFVVKKANRDKNAYDSDLYLLKDGQVRRLTAGGDASAYLWTQEGRLLFSANRLKADKERAEKGEAFTAFYEIDPCFGEAQKRFELPLKGARLIELGQDKYAVLASQDNAPSRPECEGGKKPPYEIITELPFWSNGGGFVSQQRQRLYLYDAKTGQLDPVTAPWFDVSSIQYSNGYLVFVGQEFQGIPNNKDGLYSYELATKTLRELVPVGELYLRAGFALKNSVVFVASDGRVYGDDRYPDFYTIPQQGGQYKLLHEYEASVGHGSVGSDARLGGGRGSKVFQNRLYFLSTIRNDSFLYSLGEEGDLRLESGEHGSIDSFDVAEGKLLLCALYGDRLAELYENGKQATDLNGRLLSELELSTPIAHSFTSRGGVTIDGWAMKPIGYEPGKKYPAILHIHGGPRTVFSEVFHQEMQLWAANGYFVFYCNPRGSDGRGNAFGDLCGKYGSIDYEDLMDFADEMLRQYPDADEKRFGVGGGSYGGFMTNWIIGHTDRFAAAVSQRSISNWIAFEHTTDIGYFFTPSQHGTTTRQDVRKLWDLSPLKYAPNAVTPTLFIHSDQDYRCWMVEGLSMFTALKLHGCPAKLCLFHGENHELSRSGRPLNRIKRMEEILSWFNKYLKEEKA